MMTVMIKVKKKATKRRQILRLDVLNGLKKKMTLKKMMKKKTKKRIKKRKKNLKEKEFKWKKG